MALFPYSRLAHLFEVIQAERLPQAELAKRFRVSSRTIRTDINELNDILRHYGAKIVYKRVLGYDLHVEDQTLFSTLHKQQHMIQAIPRTARDRVNALLMKLLLTSHPVKLDDIAEAWCISRGTLQYDMSAVREVLGRYPLQLESISRQGIRLKGDEYLIRACLTETLLHRFSSDTVLSLSQFNVDVPAHIDLIGMAETLQNSLNRFNITLTHESRRYLLFNCIASLLRIRYPIAHYKIHPLESSVQDAAEEISASFSLFLGHAMPYSEICYLGQQITALRMPQHDDPVCSLSESQRWADDILNDINETYHYDLRHDSRLKCDLADHLRLLVSRLQHRVSTKNPLLAEIKQHYPFAYDVVVNALTRLEGQFPCPISEDDLGYLAVHIGVGLERHYGAGYRRPIPVLLVTDADNAIQRMIEAKMIREFSQLKIQRTLSYHEYHSLDYVEENFVVTTLRLNEKNKPLVKISPFITPHQTEMIRRLTRVDQTRFYVLERFFERRYFMVIKEEVTQEALFKKVCRKLHAEGYVNDGFYSSLVERESIISTLLGENIALPHALGLLALKTVIVTILAPKGIEWHKDTRERANVIFLLAISEEDYEEAMSIYDLFVTFVREKATKRLLSSRNFDDFKLIAKDSLGRAI
ncbi:BglG family transcription antiterminator [Xenorhabdus szentirmaii]|uniref:BglG family transcription antiterminator n=1 Tax=Xenorhabdus szentirmaii TaxID=290112 RepID=UPI0019AC8C5D|nr:PRD domain-containing protein [Xenorhabdus sp. 38]MBD2780249.1 BglG family transcription antiterminator [Xenorhabdus sp. 38]